MFRSVSAQALQISARAANAANEEAAYELSPLTRWMLGHSGGIVADADVPPAPSFGLVLSPTQGGVLRAWRVAFAALTNTLSIIAGTYTFHFYDEVNGRGADCTDAGDRRADTNIAFGTTFATGALLQIEQEIVQMTGTNTDGSSAVVRGAQGTTAASHCRFPAPPMLLSESVLIVPFIKELLRQPGERRLEVQRCAAERPARQRGTLYDKRTGRWGRRA